MPSVNDYREIKIQRTELTDRIKNLTQKEWMKACGRLGLRVMPSYGKGSHCAVYKDNVCRPEDNNCCVVTLPCNIYPNFQRDLLKKIILYGVQSNKYEEDDVWMALGIRKKK